MIKKRFFLYLPLFFLLSVILLQASGGTDPELTPWNDYLEMHKISVDSDWGRHVRAADSSEVLVADFEYDNEGRLLNAFYPPESTFDLTSPVLLLIGNPDAITRQDDQRLPYRQTVHALGWAQVMAEEGFVVITYQSESTPEKDAVEVVNWIRQKGVRYGMDSGRIGLFSTSNSCISGLKATRPGKGGIPYPSVSFSVLAYGSLMNLSGLDTNVSYCVVTAAHDTSWTDQTSVASFLGKMGKTDAGIRHIHHNSGGHAFEMQEDNGETQRVLDEMIGFMRSSVGL